MQHDEFNRSIARLICLERYIECEIARLDDKARILRERGKLTPTEARWDADRRNDAEVYLNASRARPGEAAKPQPPRSPRPRAGTGMVAVLALLAGVARAEPPPGTDLDGPLHAWFERQHNVNGGWCCDLGDGEILPDDAWRITTNGYEVMLGGAWHDIPPHALRDTAGGPNPTGKAILWHRGELIFCFAPGTLT